MTTGWLLDTNILSELRRPKPERKVLAFVAAQPLDLLYISAVALAEIRFEAEPWRTSRELFERLQAEQPGAYGDGQLRTLQRRLKGWRREVAHRMVFGATAASEMTQGDAATGAGP